MAQSVKNPPAIQETACNTGDTGLIPELGRSPGEGNGNPLQYSCLETPWTVEPGGLESMGLQELDVTYWLNHHCVYTHTHTHTHTQASLVAQMIKNLPAMRGDLSSIPGLGRSPGGGHGNPLQYSFLENPHGQEERGGLQSMGSQRVRHDWVTKRIRTHTHIYIFPSFVLKTAFWDLGSLFNC